MLDPYSLPDGINLSDNDIERVNSTLCELDELKREISDENYVAHINVAISELAGWRLMQHNEIDTWRDYND